MREKCVETCPSKSTTQENGHVCKTCENADPQKPYLKGEECVAACEETNKNGVCMTCVEVDAKTPVWEKGKCMSCAEKDITKPVWVTSECKACSAVTPKIGDLWDPMTEECVATCPSKDTPGEGVVVCKTC